MVTTAMNGSPLYKSIEITLKVPFHDLDPMHVVWHGNYFKYFDTARFELFKQAGVDLYEYSFAKNITFPVSRSSIKHIAPLNYHDEFICQAVVMEAERKIAMEFEIRLRKTGRVCARGKGEQVAVTVPAMELQYKIPEEITQALMV